MKPSDWKVDEWFSTDREAGRWNDMYTTADPRPEEESFRRRRDYAVSLVSDRAPKGSRVLDLGCGTGAVVAELARAGYAVTGLDYSPDMLQYARRRLDDQDLGADKLLRGDASRLPFPDEGFHCVVCLGVISYQVDYTTVLREVRRVLVPGSTALITFRNVFHPIFSDPWEATKALGRYVVRRERPHAVGMGRALHPTDVRHDIEAAGLRCEDFLGIGLGPPKIGGRQLIGDRAAIKIDRQASRMLRRMGLRRAEAWCADVAMFVCRKDD